MLQAFVMITILSTVNTNTLFEYVARNSHERFM